MTIRSSLWDQFQQLSNTVDTNAVSAIPFGDANQHLLVKGKFGEPVLLLATEARATPRADIRLKHIYVAFEKQFEVSNAAIGKKEVKAFCKFSCNSESSHLHRYFVELMAATAKSHDGILSQHEADSVVTVLLELFRRLAQPPRKSIAGLWGELLLVYLATAAGPFVEAWHSTTTDSFDFDFKDLRIEVKTTERSTRVHEFSLHQVRPGRENDYVASVMLSRSSAGESVLDLALQIAKRLNDIQSARLWGLVLETLGDDAESADEVLFDVKSASDSLVFIPSTLIPAPYIADDAVPFVFDVHFKANIASIAADSASNRKALLEKAAHSLI